MELYAVKWFRSFYDYCVYSKRGYKINYVHIFTELKLVGRQNVFFITLQRSNIALELQRILLHFTSVASFGSTSAREIDIHFKDVTSNFAFQFATSPSLSYCSVCLHQILNYSIPVFQIKLVKRRNTQLVLFSLQTIKYSKTLSLRVVKAMDSTH